MWGGLRATLVRRGALSTARLMAAASQRQLPTASLAHSFSSLAVHQVSASSTSPSSSPTASTLATSTPAHFPAPTLAAPSAASFALPASQLPAFPQRTHRAADLAQLPLGTRVTLCGWVQRRRELGGLLFLLLRDHSGTIQCTWAASAVTAPGTPPALAAQFRAATEVSVESAVTVTGVLRARPGDAARRAPTDPTGHLELQVLTATVENAAQPLPVTFLEAGKMSDELQRLRYRYLDLRRPFLQTVLRKRAAITLAARSHLAGEGFVEVETPFLVKSTPEGAREFLVPTRAPGQFYALPQSPQQHKQLLMAAGVDRYFQIARCFRDESGRQDRQPEFTQIDLELSWASQAAVMTAVEGLVSAVHRAATGAPLALPLPRITYREAMNRFGSDKPDLRFGLEFADVSELFAAQLPAAAEPLADPFLRIAQRRFARRIVASASASSSAAATCLARDTLPCVKALVVPGLGRYLRLLPSAAAKALQAQLQEEARLGGSPAGALILDADRWRAPAAFATLRAPAFRSLLTQQLGAHPDDAVVLVAGAWERTCLALGRVRSALIRHLTAPPPPDAAEAVASLHAQMTAAVRPPSVTDPVRFAWVVDFPLFELTTPVGDEGEEGLAAGAAGAAVSTSEAPPLAAMHHPFTAPIAEDLPVLERLFAETGISAGPTSAAAVPVFPALSRAQVAAAAQVRAQHYDLIACGLEVGGGSVRLHRGAAQRAVLQLLGVPPHKFSHLLEALDLGCPPHGGFAAGLDRLVSLLASPHGSALSLRDVIAFPKSLRGADLLLGSPAPATDQQLAEYAIRVAHPETDPATHSATGPVG